jgi:cell division protein FtsW
MGTTSSVNPKNLIPPSANPLKRFQKVDLPLLLIVASLLFIGLLAVWSASLPSTKLLTHQIEMALLGIIAMIIMAVIDYHHFEKWSVHIILATMAMLLAVLFINRNSSYLRGILGSSVHPSEFAKPIIIIYISVWLTAKKDFLSDVRLGLLPMSVILGVTGGLIAIQPDISAAGTIIILGGLLFFLISGEFKQILRLFVPALLFGVLVVFIAGKIDRIVDFIPGLTNPVNADYQNQRALEAIAKGGLFGVGIGQSSTKFTGLPFPWTDSIFCVIAEETGLFGAAFVIILYILLLQQGIKIARKAPDTLGQLLASGLTLWIMIEVLLNILSMLNIAPIIGNALPFISYGGSSLITTMASIGILFNISYQAGKKEKEQEGSAVRATINMRGRDWRRSVSRDRGPSSSAK